MTPVENEDKILLCHASKGSNHLYVSNSINIDASDVIIINDQNSDKREYLIIDHITGSIPGDEGPVHLHLTHPITYTHSADTIIKKILPHVNYDLPLKAVIRLLVNFS